MQSSIPGKDFGNKCLEMSVSGNLSQYVLVLSCSQYLGLSKITHKVVFQNRADLSPEGVKKEMRYWKIGSCTNTATKRMINGRVDSVEQISI